MDGLQAGVGEYKVEDPDELRAFMRTEKRRERGDKVRPEAEAVRRYVKDGDYVSFDFSSFTRGPASLVREIIRQRRQNLWFAATFALMESTLLAAAGCLRGIDVGFLGLGSLIGRGGEEGGVKGTNWTNGSLTLRHLAGAVGVPFLPG